MEYPDLFEKISQLYKKGGAGKEYKEGLYAVVNRLRNKYGITGAYSGIIKEKMYKEKTLFDE